MTPKNDLSLLPIMMEKPLAPIFTIEKVKVTNIISSAPNNNNLVTTYGLNYYRGGMLDNTEDVPIIDSANMEDARLYLVDKNGYPVRLDYQHEIN